jgi:membrane protein required for colicin V production
MVSYLDILLVLILGWAIWRGWVNGFVAEMFSFLAFFVGIYASVYLSEPVGKMLGATDDGMGTRVGVFLIIFLIVVVGMYFLGKFITSKIKGGTEKWNKALGSLFSLAKYMLGMGSLFVMLHALDSKFHVLPQEQKSASVVYEPLNNFSRTLFPEIKEFEAQLPNDSTIQKINEKRPLP